MDRPFTYVFDKPGANFVSHSFDQRYGVDTSGLIDSGDLQTPYGNAIWSTAYYGITPSIFEGVMAQVEDLLHPQWAEFTFIDFGSGKGRALMLASRLPFRRLVGVELSPDLCGIARDSLVCFRPPWRRCFDVRIDDGDVTQFELPLTPLVVFLYNPFLPPVLKRCLDNLRRSLIEHPREVILVYVAPEYESVVEDCGFLEKRWSGRLAMTEEDAAEDRFSRDGESAAVFVSSLNAGCTDI